MHWGRGAFPSGKTTPRKDWVIFRLWNEQRASASPQAAELWWNPEASKAPPPLGPLHSTQCQKLAVIIHHHVLQITLKSYRLTSGWRRCCWNTQKLQMKPSLSGTVIYYIKNCKRIQVSGWCIWFFCSRICGSNHQSDLSQSWEEPLCLEEIRVQ